MAISLSLMARDSLLQQRATNAALPGILFRHNHGQVLVGDVHAIFQQRAGNFHAVIADQLGNQQLRGIVHDGKTLGQHGQRLHGELGQEAQKRVRRQRTLVQRPELDPEAIMSRRERASSAVSTCSSSL